MASQQDNGSCESFGVSLTHAVSNDLKSALKSPDSLFEALVTLEDLLSPTSNLKEDELSYNVDETGCRTHISPSVGVDNFQMYRIPVD